MTKIKAIQICGTGSDVGKSILVTALCRIFSQDGFRACPFKAQNMSLNSFVTKEGGEIGRAQATQAQACGLEPHVDMNPILIKPTSHTGAQIILQGKPLANMSARKYQNKHIKGRLLQNIKQSLSRLKRKYGVLVIEGAGSPVEINLKEHDIVNIKIAEILDAPVILVADIDKGGVFASLVGTMELLTKAERQRIKGFVINKFRGDKSLLKGGLRFLEKRTNRPVLGVIPYFEDIKIPQEDSVVLERLPKRSLTAAKFAEINIAVIKLPHMSNFTDFDALENESDVRLSYIEDKKELNGQHIVIIPGTKNTIEDLLWLRKKKIAQRIREIIDSHKTLPVLIGICGGYQMLGASISDPNAIESKRKVIQGLRLLPIKTRLEPEKILKQTDAIEIETGIKVRGYQIHHGCTKGQGFFNPMFRILNENRLDGAFINHGRIWGTYLHGIFDNDIFRRRLLNRTRKKNGLNNMPTTKTGLNLEIEFDKLADLVRKNLDIDLLYRILNRDL